MDTEITVKCIEHNKDNPCVLKERHIEFSTNGESATIFIDNMGYSFGKEELESVIKLLKETVNTNLTISLLRKQNNNLQEELKKLKA